MYALEPTSNVCVGVELAIPTLEVVVKPVIAFENWSVFDVTLPVSVISWRFVMSL